MLTLCSSQIPHRLAREGKEASAVRGRRVTGRVMTLYFLVLCSILYYFNNGVYIGPARRQQQHIDCIYSHHTDGLHYNSRMVLAHFIINRTTLIFLSSWFRAS